MREFSARLHHNFDKLALLGGSSMVRYGEGTMTSSVRALVNGRASPGLAGRKLDVEILFEETVVEYFIAGVI